MKREECAALYLKLQEVAQQIGAHIEFEWRPIPESPEWGHAEIRIAVVVGTAEEGHRIADGIAIPQQIALVEAARIAKVHPGTLRRAIKNKSLQATRVGVVWLVTRLDLARWMHGPFRRKS